MYIVEPERKIPVAAETDVLIAGGGTAGLPAALAAARAGADVLLVEKFGYIGGQASGGLTITIPDDRQGTVTREMEERLKKVGGVGYMNRGHMNDNLVWCPELFKWMSVVMLEEAQVRMLLYTSCVGTLMEDGAIKGVIVENKGGRQAIRAKIVVDCTGDADIAFLSGAECKKGDANGAMLPPTMMAMIAGVDESKTSGGRIELQGFPNAITQLYPGYINVWLKRIEGIDCTDPWELTRYENESRKLAAEALFSAKKNVPGCENAFLSMTGTQPGVRETRKIVGEYWMTEEDWQSGRFFDDHVGYAYVGISVPYRSLLPKKVENLIVAGRCVACENNTMRLIPSVMVTGYAAGAAAAIAARNNTTPKNIDVGELQKMLKKDGVPFTREASETFHHGKTPSKFGVYK